jgi:hypothetical protein
VGGAQGLEGSLNAAAATAVAAAVTAAAATCATAASGFCRAVFLAVFKWEARKGWKDLIQGFTAAFKLNDLFDCNAVAALLLLLLSPLQCITSVSQCS